MSGRRSRHDNDDGEPTLLRSRDPQLLVNLRKARPDAKGRPNRHLSQRQAAVTIGISHAHLADIERGDRHPSYRVGQAIADFYDVQLDALFDAKPFARSKADVA